MTAVQAGMDAQVADNACREFGAACADDGDLDVAFH
jgi:hypothetical protein